MKKIFLFIILLLTMPVLVYADGIKNFYVNATVLDNGDLQVEEYFDLTGYFNGFERILQYKNINSVVFNPSANSYGGSSIHNGDDISIMEVRAVPINDNFNFDEIEGNIFKLVESANKGDYGVYTESSKTGGKALLVYLPSSRNMAFYIKYIIKNMAILHNDVAELGWNIVGNELTEDIDNLRATIKMPGNDKELKVWAHGPLNGSSSIESKDSVSVMINNLEANTAIDVRVVFDKSVIKNSMKKTNVMALNKILAYENEQAEKANNERKEYDEMHILRIEGLFKNMDQRASRYTYNEIESLITDLYDVEKRKELFNKLILYKDKVDKDEYAAFREYFNDNMTYKDYTQAATRVENVFSLELKAKMSQELSEMKSIVIKNERRKDMFTAIIPALTIVFAFAFYYIYKWFQKRIKHTDPTYIRELPSNMAPDEVGLFVNRTLGKNEISAILLDLIRQKKISVRKNDGNSYDLIIPTPSCLTDDESRVKNMIFGSKKIISSNKIGRIDFDKFDTYQKKVMKHLSDKELIKEKNGNLDNILITLGIIITVYGLLPIGLLLIIMGMVYKRGSSFILWLCLPVNIIFCLYGIFENHFSFITPIVAIAAFIIIKKILKAIPILQKIRYTSKGKAERKKWLAFRNFLLDFSNFSDKEIPEVALWEEYLVYAVALGIGKKVLSSMKMKIENMDGEMIGDSDLLMSYSTMSLCNTIAATTTRSLNSTVLRTLSNTSYGGGSGGSSGGYSSGGGGGGGFSSGGGSFGGGGGGGRF